MRRPICFLLALLCVLLSSCSVRETDPPDFEKNPYAEGEKSSLFSQWEEVRVLDAVSDSQPFSARTHARCAVESLRETVPGGQWYSADTTVFYPESSAKSGERYLTLVLEEADIEGVCIQFYQGGESAEDIRAQKGRSYLFYVLASSDGKNWDGVYPATYRTHGQYATSSTDGGYDEIEFSYQGAKYLRIGGIGSVGDSNEADGKYFAIRNVKIYGTPTGNAGGDALEGDGFEPRTPEPYVLKVEDPREFERPSEPVKAKILSDFEAYLRHEVYPDHEILSVEPFTLKVWGESRGRYAVEVGAKMGVMGGLPSYTASTETQEDTVCGISFPPYSEPNSFGLSGIYYDGRFYKMSQAFAEGIITVEDVALFHYYLTGETEVEVFAYAPRRTTVYFVRHGKSDYTVSTNATAHLNQRGYVQSYFISNYFTYRLPKLQAIYSSPYQRCLDTVEPLSNELRLEVKVNPFLYERTIGSEVEKIPSGFAAAQFEDFDYKLVGGESLNEVRYRMVLGLSTIFADLVDEAETDTVMVSTHAAALTSLLNYYDPSWKQEVYDRIISMATPCVKCVFEGAELIGLEMIDIPA